MKTGLMLTLYVLLFGCGAEVAGTAAIAGKMQADQAKQATDNLDKMKSSIEASTSAGDARNKALEEAAKN